MRPLLLALVCAGCSQVPNVTDLEPVCRVQQQLLNKFYMEGEEAVVNVGEAISCSRGLARQATKLTVAVADTDGVMAAATVGDIEHVGWTNTAPVTFTPTHAGVWVLDATFDSKSRPLHYEVQVVARAHPAEQVLPWNGPTDCTSLGTTSKATLLCMRSLMVPQVVTARGEVFDGVAFEREGDALWVLTKAGLLERRLDDGTAFTVTHSGSPAGLAGPMVVIAGDAWMPSGDAALAKVHPQADGTFSVTTIPRPKLPVAAIAGNDRGLMLWITGPNPNQPSLVYVDPAGVATPKQMATAHSSHFLLGADGDRIWVTGQVWTDEDATSRSRLVVERIAGSVTDPLKETAIELSQQLDLTFLYDQPFGSAPPVALMTAAPNGMLQRVRKALPKFDGDTMAFETFPTGDGFGEVLNATRTHAFAFALDGKSVKVFTRN